MNTTTNISHGAVLAQLASKLADSNSNNSIKISNNGNSMRNSQITSNAKPPRVSLASNVIVNSDGYILPESYVKGSGGKAVRKISNFHWDNRGRFYQKF